jgi:transcriptional regulator with GAF, ATPase, and Fis domain
LLKNDSVKKGSTMSDKILFCWLGMTDLKAAKGEIEGSGPIAQAVKSFDFSEVHLLSDLDAKVNKDYLTWLQALTTTTIELHSCSLANPMDFATIYEAVTTTLDAVKQKNTEQRRYCFHISPGTSAMAAIWIILAKTAYPAELLQSSREEGIKVIDIPFELAADYRSPLAMIEDDDILRLTQGLPPQVAEFDDIIYRCQAMREAVERSRLVALHSIPVLKNGESGTGKELFARAIHASSPRKMGPFIEVNCGAIPENLFESEFFGHEKGAFTGAVAMKQGYIESADGGTLFLDEIGELPLYAQVKLLRVVQEQAVVRVGATEAIKVNVRIISATNRNLMIEVAEKRFREDLFHRLAIGIIQLPSLRERQGDLGLLIEYFIADINQEFEKINETVWVKRKLSAGAKNQLLQYSWPGNIRELRNTITRLILWAQRETITVKDVAGAIFRQPNEVEKSLLTEQLANLTVDSQGFKLKQVLSEIAGQFIDKALAETNGNKSQAAKLLGFNNYQTLDNWQKKQ